MSDIAARLRREADCSRPPGRIWWNGQHEALLREAASMLDQRAKALEAADELARAGPLDPASTEREGTARVDAAIAKVIPAGYKMLRECSHVHDGAKADLADALGELFDASSRLTDLDDEGADRSEGGASEPPLPEQSLDEPAQSAASTKEDTDA